MEKSRHVGLDFFDLLIARNDLATWDLSEIYQRQSASGCSPACSMRATLSNYSYFAFVDDEARPRNISNNYSGGHSLGNALPASSVLTFTPSDSAACARTGSRRLLGRLDLAGPVHPASRPYAPGSSHPP